MSTYRVSFVVEIDNAASAQETLQAIENLIAEEIHAQHQDNSGRCGVRIGRATEFTAEEPAGAK